jgi:hypothetical protein
MKVNNVIEYPSRDQQHHANKNTKHASFFAVAQQCQKMNCRQPISIDMQKTTMTLLPIPEDGLPKQ